MPCLVKKNRFDCGPDIVGEVALFTICLPVGRSFPFVKFVKKHCFFIMLLSVDSN